MGFEPTWGAYETPELPVLYPAEPLLHHFYLFTTLALLQNPDIMLHAEIVVCPSRLENHLGNFVIDPTLLPLGSLTLRFLKTIEP